MKGYNFQKSELHKAFLFLLISIFCLACHVQNDEKVGKVYLDSIPKSKRGLPTRIDTAYSVQDSNNNEKAGKVYLDADRGLPTRIDTAYSAQDSINYALIPLIKSELWDTLRNIKYDKEGVYGHKPYFTAKHKALHGKQIKIQGYMHPLEATALQKWFMLSYFPSSACFFCGAAGPETAIEVKSPKGIIFKRDKLITLQGKMLLNFDEPERLFYLIEEAELVE